MSKSFLLICLLFRAVDLSAEGMADADLSFERFRYNEAITEYENLLDRSPQDPHLLWKLARTYVCLGDVSAINQQEALYRKAEEYARACINAEPSLSEGHSWLAASLGSTAMFVGNRTKVALSREIKNELDIALQLNPNDVVALTILGSFHRALANISWVERRLADWLLGGLPTGGYQEGEAAFQKALSLDPGSIRHRFELAMLYHEAGQVDKSLELMRAAIGLRPQMLSDVRRIDYMKSMLASAPAR